MDDTPERAFDAYLVSLIQAGSADALDGLARRWTPRLLRYVARVLGGSGDATDTARDVVQETWIGAMRTLPGLRDPARFPAWIYGIATRKCADVIRTNQRRRRLDDSVATYNVGVGAHIAPEDQIDLATAIRELPPMHRAVIHLFYREDLRVDEIASILRIPPGTVKSRLHNAREALRHRLASCAEHRESETHS